MHNTATGSHAKKRDPFYLLKCSEQGKTEILGVRKVEKERIFFFFFFTLFWKDGILSKQTKK